VQSLVKHVYLQYDILGLSRDDLQAVPTGSQQGEDRTRLQAAEGDPGEGAPGAPEVSKPWS
jgi:hypothetical protein